MIKTLSESLTFPLHSALELLKEGGGANKRKFFIYPYNNILSLIKVEQIGPWMRGERGICDNSLPVPLIHIIYS